MRQTISSLALGLLIPLLGSTASAQCPPEEPVLQNYTGAGTVTCPCFVSGEEAGVILDVPASHYPIEILRIQIGWGSQFGGAPQSLESSIHLYPAGLPTPGAPQFSLPAPALTDGFINEFDISLTPGNKTLNSGPFMVSLEFLNSNAGMIFSPSTVHDGNGCQPGKNSVFAIPGGWSDACALGVTGDWVMGVVYKRLNCDDCGELATATFRNPGGSNPTSLFVGGSNGGAPALGGTIDFFVNAFATTGHTNSTVLGYLSGSTTTLMGGQVVLVDLAHPAGDILSLGLQGGDTNLIGLPVPNDTSFCGMTLYTQGVHILGVQPFALSNGYDLRVGD